MLFLQLHTNLEDAFDSKLHPASGAFGSNPFKEVAQREPRCDQIHIAALEKIRWSGAKSRAIKPPPAELSPDGA
ncbi:hypothetical protein GCM10028812_52780 [Ancylobacter sonchi]